MNISAWVSAYRSARNDLEDAIARLENLDARKPCFEIDDKKICHFHLEDGRPCLSFPEGATLSLAQARKLYEWLDLKIEQEKLLRSI